MWLQTDMVSAGYASCFHDQIPLPADAAIQERVQTWAKLADDKQVFATFDNQRSLARATPPADQCRSCVHGKKFWNQVVHPALRIMENRQDWLIDLAEWSMIPVDLAPLLLRPLQ